RRRGIAEIAPPHKERHAPGPTTNPPLDRRDSWPEMVFHRDASGFGRQRPAGANVPFRPFNAVPIHFVWSDAAQKVHRPNSPPVLIGVAVYEDLHLVPLRIHHEPNGRPPSCIPVPNGLEPLVLGWRRKLRREFRRLGTEPCERPAKVEGLT